MARIPIFHRIQTAYHALFRAADQSLKATHGLTASQYGVLFLLEQRGALLISEIADELKMGRSSLTQLIDRMAEKGYVSRVRNPQDGRSFRIQLEPQGEVMIKQTLPLLKQVNQALLEPFSTKEREVIERFLVNVSLNADVIMKETLSN